LRLALHRGEPIGPDIDQRGIARCDVASGNLTNLGDRTAVMSGPRRRNEGVVESEAGSDHVGFRVLHMRTLATGKDTNEAFELVEDLRNQGEGPARHIHRGSDEAFYVLGGDFKFVRDEENVDAPAGTLVFVPRGTPHLYRATTDGSRVLILFIPAGAFIEFLRELDHLLQTGMGSAEAMATLRGKFDSDPA
jgi:quercetin dioxygenase-like cupin family protein